MSEEKKEEWADKWDYLPICYDTTSYKDIITMECEEEHTKGKMNAWVFSCVCGGKSCMFFGW